MSLWQGVHISLTTFGPETDRLSADSCMTLAVTKGTEGLPIPYSPRADDGIAAVLLTCFLIASYVLARSKKFLLQQLKDFMLHRERSSIFADSTAVDVRYLLLLVLQSCILAGLYIFNYFNDIQPDSMRLLSPHLWLGIYMGMALLYLAAKWLLYSFLGWTFFDKNITNLWLGSYATLIYYGGFVLFPCVLLVTYFDVNVFFLITLGICLLIFAKILMFYKWLKLFFNNIHGLFLLILYFCALEIMPCFMLYQGVMQVNDLLIIKN